MINFEKIINKLSREKRTKSKLFISIYCPLIQGDRKDFVKRLNSLLHSRVYKPDAILQNKKVFDSIQTQLIAEIYRTENLKKGTAIFISLNKETEIAKLVLVPLHKRPIQEAFVGSNYELDQLVWIASMKNDALILNIQENMAAVYEYEQDELDLIFKIENSFYAKETSLKFSKREQKISGQVIESTKYKKLETQKSEGIDAYIHTIIEQIEKFRDNGKLGFYNFVISYYPSKYSPVISQFEKKLDKFSIFPLISKIQQIENYKEIHSSTETILKNAQTKITTEIWDQAKQNKDKFVTGWYYTAKASRENKIKNLFIKATAKKKGFLLNYDKAYTYAVKNSKKVNNIGPWIAKRTVENKGRVYQSQKFQKEDEEIAAELL